MTVNPLPPQAYTKETLQKAYAWLLTQNASVKDMATSQDILVSMYLKAQRNGEGALETPSIQNFKQELKNLASIIGDLQGPQQAAPLSQSAPPTAQSFTTPLPTYNNHATGAASPRMPQNFIPSSPAVPGLDEQSLMAIQEVRATLNLSSDLEALRALISLGIKQFKKM